MSRPAITIENVWKEYHIRRTRNVMVQSSFKEVINAPINRLVSAVRRGQPNPDPQRFFALKDVSFTVEHGESVGLIGRNGAGKSTMLKILARIARPSQGRVTLYEHVNSLLEVGTGFNMELSGRDNVFLNGSFLGMRVSEIRRKFDEIVAFSEVEEFIDTPVKYYSSGMYVRLAFSVAVHLTPQILLLDEVLAVGDAGFQEKSRQKMLQLLHGGATILFVSHNLEAVCEICQRAVWLDKGQVRMDGEVWEVVDNFRESMNLPRVKAAAD